MRIYSSINLQSLLLVLFSIYYVSNSLCMWYLNFPHLFCLIEYTPFCSAFVTGTHYSSMSYLFLKYGRREARKNRWREREQSNNLKEEEQSTQGAADTRLCINYLKYYKSSQKQNAKDETFKKHSPSQSIATTENLSTMAKENILASSTSRCTSHHSSAADIILVIRRRML